MVLARQGHASDIRRVRFPEDPDLFRFSSAVIADGMIFCSGRIALDPATGKPAAPDAGGQARWVLQRLNTDLQRLGSGLDSVVRVEALLARRSDFDAWDQAFADAFGTALPARTTYVVELLSDGILIELQATAVLAP